MRIIVMVLALALLLVLAACSAASHSEGCWITHNDDTKLNPEVPLPREGEPLALSPGDSYQVWCARKINESSIGDIITEDQRTIRINPMPADAELRVYPNERDAVYVGQPVASSADVWKGFREASSTSDRRRLISQIEGAVIAVFVVVILVLGIMVVRRVNPSSESGNGVGTF